MTSLSLQARLLIGVAVVAAVVLAVAALVTTTTRDYLIGRLDNQLLEAAAFGRTFPLPVDGVPPPAPVPAVVADDENGEDDQHREPERLSPMFQGLLTPDNELVTIFAPNLPGRAYSPPDFVEPPPLDRPFTVSSVDDQYDYRVVAIDDPFADGLRIQAMALSDVEDVIDRMVLYQAIGLAAVLVILTAVSWWVYRLGIRPIKLMTVTASEIADGDLSVRVPDGSVGGTEAGRLAGALNTMMGRIQQAMSAQEESERRLRRFMADASHELRTPITTVRGYAELYRRGGLDSRVELDDAMRRTEQESRRMERLVHDMLTLANLDQGRDLEQDVVDVSAVVVDAGKDAVAVEPDRSVTVEVESGLSMVGDEDRLRQVLANIVANALSHTPTDSPITLTARGGDDGSVVIEVVDGGPGMASDVVDRVTERFYRADPSRSRASGGAGLGLSIAEAVVEAHGGELSIMSAVETGTTVEITLPRPPPSRNLQQ